MAATDPLTSMPDSVASGTTLKLKLSFTSFPASSGWVATLWLAGAGVASVAGTASVDAFTFTFASSATAKWTPGAYQWRITAVKSGETYVADSGVLTVLPNLAAAGAGDMQSFA